MCAIAGYVSKQKPEPNIIKAMTERMAHRGPDGEGFFLDENCALGHRRLAIIDLNTGAQPMYNEDNTIVAVYNGEIYNFKALREELQQQNHVFQTQSDTEVLLHGYEEWGVDLPQKLSGMFAFAIWDSRKQQLFLARDGFGIKPLYYYQNGDTFLFASEIKGFLGHPKFEKQLNEAVLSAYLCFGSTPTAETFFKGVYRLEPGCCLIYQNGKKTIQQYFRFDLQETEGQLDTIADDIQKAMKHSVACHTVADVEVGAFLSSGIDSSYIVSLAKPAKTYTAGYKDKRYDEIAYAKELADRLHIENRSVTVSKEEYCKVFSSIQYYMDEPIADPSAIALYFAARLASKEVKVVLSGEGADELFGGYLTYGEELQWSWYSKVPYWIRRVLSFGAGLLPENRGFNFLYRRGRKLEDYHIGLGRIFRDEEAQRLVRCRNQIPTKQITAPFYEACKDKSNLAKRQTIDFYFWLTKCFLHAVDRNTMMFGLEARTPFLDKEVYGVARKLPIYAKVNQETTKPALRLAAKQVIPNEAYKKKKLGFPVPLREWMKEEDLYQTIKETFQTPAAKQYFNVKRLLKLLEAHKTGKKDCYKKIWTIYTFLIWYGQFFEAKENGHC